MTLGIDEDLACDRASGVRGGAVAPGATWLAWTCESMASGSCAVPTGTSGWQLGAYPSA
jgi:hypothetical protein